MLPRVLYCVMWSHTYTFQCTGACSRPSWLNDQVEQFTRNGLRVQRVEYDSAQGLDATGNGCLISDGNMALIPDGLGFSGCSTTRVLLVVLLATIQTYHKTSGELEGPCQGMNLSELSLPVRHDQTYNLCGPGKYCVNFTSWFNEK